MKKNLITASLCMLLQFFGLQKAQAQYFFDDDDWSDDRGFFLKYKYTDLFPVTFTFGAMLGENKWNSHQDFFHMNIGGGMPSADAWKPFLPAPPSGDGGPTPSSDNLIAMNIGMGWTHYFNHCVGLYVDVGWAPVFDTSSNNSEGPGGEQADSGIITSLVPIEAGVNLNIFRNVMLSSGVVYYCKETPMVTFSVGYSW